MQQMTRTKRPSRNTIWQCLWLGLAAAGPLASGTAAGASLENGSFEAENLAGWTPSSPLAVSANSLLAGSGARYAPTDGQRLALLQTDGLDVDTTLVSQPFTAAIGDRLQLDVFFSTDEDNKRLGQGANDQGYASLIDAATKAARTIYAVDVGEVLRNGNADGPWTNRSFTFDADGTYQLQFGIVNRGDDSGNSFLGADNVTISAVPLPASLGLFSLGCAALARFYRRR